MPFSFRTMLRFLRYQLVAGNGKGHGIHSPFVFEFVVRLLNDDRHFYAYDDAENRAGVCRRGSEIRVAKKYGRLLFRMVHYYGYRNILECGVAEAGVISYLAPGQEIVDGATRSAPIAVQLLSADRLMCNMQIMRLNFEEVPGTITRQQLKMDMCVLDMEHLPTTPLETFRQLLPLLHEYSVMVFRNIHTAEKAWAELKAAPQVTLSIDLFRLGLLFFRRENKVKQHFTIRF